MGDFLSQGSTHASGELCIHAYPYAPESNHVARANIFTVGLIYDFKNESDLRLSKTQEISSIICLFRLFIPADASGSS